MNKIVLYSLFLFPQDSKDSHVTFGFFNLFLEHKKNNIGIEISPMNIWINNNNSDFLMSFINTRLYYNTHAPSFA
jgi:hypothetical protein